MGYRSDINSTWFVDYIPVLDPPTSGYQITIGFGSRCKDQSAWVGCAYKNNSPTVSITDTYGWIFTTTIITSTQYNTVGAVGQNYLRNAAILHEASHQLHVSVATPEVYCDDYACAMAEFNSIQSAAQAKLCDQHRDELHIP
jgi:hypothetical protein